ncbi:MAG: hypothetical protein KGL95_05350 [Patescibacteria group bacterium]|nr:hypothetical protein [Patescibacteria group bacterium]
MSKGVSYVNGYKMMRHARKNIVEIMGDFKIVKKHVPDVHGYTITIPAFTVNLDVALLGMVIMILD